MADVANAGLYAAGHEVEAGLALAAAVPMRATSSTAGRFAYKGAKAGNKVYPGWRREDAAKGPARNPNAATMSSRTSRQTRLAVDIDDQGINVARENRLAPRCKIDLSKVELSRQGPVRRNPNGPETTRTHGWAAKDQEVLIQGRVPAGAARRLP